MYEAGFPCSPHYAHSDCKGEMGEEAVAEALAAATAAPGSPLSGDAVIRAVRLPGMGADWRGGAVAASEADFVILSDCCAFVIEAKNRAVHVDVAPDASTARLFDACGNPLDGDPVSQNARHAESVRRLCKVYPASRVFNVSAFVNPLSLGGCVGEFVGTRAVVGLSGLVGLLERKQSELRSYLPDDWIEPAAACIRALAAQSDFAMRPASVA